MPEAGADRRGPVPAVVSCPHCGGAVEAALGDKPQVVDCPHCSAAFVLPAADGTALAVAQVPGVAPAAEEEGFCVTDEPARPADDRDDEMDGLRIRKIAHERRTAYRSRSYALLGMLVCLVAAAELLFKAVLHLVRGERDVRPIAYVLIAPVCVWAALRLYGKARRLLQEVAETKQPQPETPPDFSSLSDGSQQWKNLEKYAKGEAGEADDKP